MRGKVTKTLVNEDDRTADLTVEVYSDAGALLETDNVILPIDIISRDLGNERIKELLEQVQAKRATFPYTQAQIDAMFVGMVTVIPE